MSQPLQIASRKKRADTILHILDTFFPHPAIPLHHKNAYTLLIAVLLSAQCTDARVNQITPRLFKLADTPEKMVCLTPRQIEDVIRPCGLGPTKARAIWNLSQKLIQLYGSRVPNTFEELEKLPGVGHKTASVVMAQAFHIPAFPVDTHIFRCARRWKLSCGTTPTAVEKDLKNIFPKDSWIRVHLQIIYFARQFCPARGHKSEACPICSALCRNGRER
ncbi:MAG TPA: endonuclease III [Chlamydiales bacterium]|nr:endonuclease III [Chlamydiales bacterium]